VFIFIITIGEPSGVIETKPTTLRLVGGYIANTVHNIRAGYNDTFLISIDGGSVYDGITILPGNYDVELLREAIKSALRNLGAGYYTPTTPGVISASDVYAVDFNVNKATGHGYAITSSSSLVFVDLEGASLFRDLWGFDSQILSGHLAYVAEDDAEFYGPTGSLVGFAIQMLSNPIVSWTNGAMSNWIYTRSWTSGPSTPEILDTSMVAYPICRFKPISELTTFEIQLVDLGGNPLTLNGTAGSNGMSLTFYIEQW